MPRLGLSRLTSYVNLSKSPSALHVYLLLGGSLSAAAKMPPKTSPFSILRQKPLTKFQSLEAPSRAYSYFALARWRCLYERSPPRIIPYTRRPFSITTRRNFADADDSFDPRLQDRESDEVDVCIVGGGILELALRSLCLLMSYRACRFERCHTIKANSQRGRERRVQSGGPRESGGTGCTHSLGECH